MAVCCRYSSISRCFRTWRLSRRLYASTCSQRVSPSARGNWIWWGCLGMGGLAVSYALYKSRDDHVMLPVLEATESKEVKMSKREKRYKEFASVMYNGDMYMTPRDFLESIVDDIPRPHSFRVMDDKILSKALKSVPSTGNSNMFRTLWNDGILTYPDYLFLLNALIKPVRHFEIVFKMIDVDGSNSIDIGEFDRMQVSIIRRQEHTKLDIVNDTTKSSLLVHLFGPRGNKKLSSDDLLKFINYLQVEVRQMEFQKHSCGGPTISPAQFASIILRNASYNLNEVADRLKSEPNLAEQGITFEQYNDFCQLLNALEDFAIAMTMYTIAGQSVTEDEFARASKVSVGKTLDPTVIHTVFKIFDKDGDGKLSYKEFLSVMKNWQVRSMKMQQTKSKGMWPEFKTCVNLHMRNN